MEKQPWSTNSSAPKWRRVSHGLCIEGICLNKHCQAHGQRVICSAGFTTLDLVQHSWRIRCPTCNNMIDPVIVAFNNCEWKVAGTKRAHADAAPEAVDQQEWQVAGNCYERFKDDPTDQTIWSSLVISTRKPGSSHEAQPPLLAMLFGQQTAQPAQFPAPPTTSDPPAPVTISIPPAPTTTSSPRGPPSSSNMVECSICCGPPMSRFGQDAINTPCGHCFHRQCLQPWLAQGKKDCPTCRRDVSCLAQVLAPQ